MKIKSVHAHEILDSRGFPTVQCDLELEGGRWVYASVPSGRSIGRWEALELRDGDEKRYLGKGVLKAVNNINTLIAPMLIGQKPHFFDLDKEIIALDGTKNKSKLGANATLAVSMALVKAQAFTHKQEVHQFLAECCRIGQETRPRVMFNLINGGMHAENNLSFQEFMVMPASEKPFVQVLEEVFFIYYNLRRLLHDSGLGSGIGDEGGFAPIMTGKFPERDALDFLVKAIEESGYTTDEYVLCLDAAASHFYDAAKQRYTVNGQTHSSDALIDYYDELCTHYPIASIEDGLAEDDELGWSALTARLGSRVQIVGDDLFVTNVERIKKGNENGYANAAIIKPNQIGTVSEAIAAVKACKEVGYHPIVSHRSGETNDTFIADFAVGLHVGQFKGGSIVRGERVAKYNRLLAIDAHL